MFSKLMTFFCILSYLLPINNGAAIANRMRSKKSGKKTQEPIIKIKEKVNQILIKDHKVQQK